VRRILGVRLPLLPAFRWRVQPVPGGVFHPVYVDDPQFDLDRHVCERTLSGPGGDEELDRLVGALAQEQLDRRHPLWQLCLVHGVDGRDRQALVLTFHHCLMDGVATVHALRCLLADEGPDPALRAYGSAGATPGPARMVALAARALLRASGRLPALLHTTVKGGVAAKAAWSTATPQPPAHGEVPLSLLNIAYSPERRFARTRLPLAEMQLIKEAAGVTFTDVALAVVAGSVRAWLTARDALPARPLVAVVAIGPQDAGLAARTFGNRVTSVRTSLATDVSDPWERLLVIGATNTQAKRLLTIAGRELLPAWLELLPPALTDRGARHHDRQRRWDPGLADASLALSNVRGLRPPCSFAGATVEELYIVGLPGSGVGVSVMLSDFGDAVSIAIIACADAVEHPAEIAAGLRTALYELAERAHVKGADQPPLFA
jgi:WS/DGAT/MGAT family acyltransferase